MFYSSGCKLDEFQVMTDHRCMEIEAKEIAMVMWNYNKIIS